MDQIHIKGLRIYAYHGVNPEEKQDGQMFEVDLTADVDLSLPGQTDRVEDTVSYAKMAKTIRRVLLAEQNDLLERAGTRVIDALLAEYPRVQAVRLTLKKPDAPMRASFDWVGITLHRRRTSI